MNLPTSKKNISCTCTANFARKLPLSAVNRQPTQHLAAEHTQRAKARRGNTRKGQKAHQQTPRHRQNNIRKKTLQIPRRQHRCIRRINHCDGAIQSLDNLTGSVELESDGRNLGGFLTWPSIFPGLELGTPPCFSKCAANGTTELECSSPKTTRQSRLCGPQRSRHPPHRERPQT